MSPDERDRFGAEMMGLQEYYGKTFSPALITVYWNALSGYEFDAIRAAIAAHVRNPDTGQFMPKVADIVKMIEGGSGDRAQVAWAKVLGAIRQIGPYQSIVFDDWTIHRVLEDIGGFSRLCEIDCDDMAYRAREFQTRYQSIAQRGQRLPYPSKIIGEIEAENRSKGYLEHVPEPVFVGDKERAQAAMLNGQTRLSLPHDEPKSIGEISTQAIER